MKGLAIDLYELIVCEAVGYIKRHQKKLLAAGVPESEVGFIHTADTEAKKKELFSKVRAGKVRVLLGRTQKMGTGTNVQEAGGSPSFLGQYPGGTAVQ